jgi:hypothetical protein
MKSVYIVVWVTIIVTAGSVNAAKLQLSEKAQAYISQSMNKSVSAPANLLNTAITGKEKMSGRPVVFEVIKAQCNDSLKRYLSRNVQRPEKVLFNPIKGSYSYSNNDLQKKVLTSTDLQSLSNLKIRAGAILEQLLGKVQADCFVAANEETDFVKECDDGEERILKKTYRFTRKINGRVILDNTSFVRISFSADQELSGFEIVNPEIKPVKSVDRLIKPEATINRLGEYAANKLTADKNGPEGVEKIGVTLISAQKGFDTYITKKAEGKTLLLPSVSFYSDYQLENGEHFDNWSHFCIDADYVPNIDSKFIESSNR